MFRIKSNILFFLIVYTKVSRIAYYFLISLDTVLIKIFSLWSSRKVIENNSTRAFERQSDALGEWVWFVACCWKYLQMSFGHSPPTHSLHPLVTWEKGFLRFEPRISRNAPALFFKCPRAIVSNDSTRQYKKLMFNCQIYIKNYNYFFRLKDIKIPIKLL